MRLVLALAAGALLLAGASSPSRHAHAQTLVRVTMTAEACRAAPSFLDSGTTLFTVANRTRKPRLFTIGGLRTRYIQPRRSASLRVGLTRSGVYRYFCISRGPRQVVRTGVVAVHPRPGPPAPPQHRIGIRSNGGEGEFFDRLTGARFVPRGNNYLRRANQELPNGQTVFQGSTFVVGRYDSSRIEAAFARMHLDGYNSVRVVLDVGCRSGCLGDFDTRGLSSAYLDNVADFLRRAKANEIEVLLANEGPVPAGTAWEATVDRSCCATFARTNLYYLTLGGIDGTALFWQTFLRQLLARHAPLDIVFGYSLASEAYFEADKPPLSQSSGSVTTATGHTYDMTSAADRQLMMDESLVNFTDHVRAAIREVDPTALVGMGFLWPQSPNPARRGDPRLIRTGPMLSGSDLDYLDLHLSPKIELTFPQYVENFELPRVTAKPIVTGSYGLSKPAEPDVTQAASVLTGWQRDSCAYGFDGWLFSTWDTSERASGEPDLWSAVDSGGIIEHALAPSARPDPCAP